jgi:putative iron-dependent peroxidase
MTVPAQPIEEPAPQPVVSPLTAAAVFLVLGISPGGEDTVRDLLEDLSGLGAPSGSASRRAAPGASSAIGSDAWDRLFAGPRPRELHPFRGARRAAPHGAGHPR